MYQEVSNDEKSEGILRFLLPFTVPLLIFPRQDSKPSDLINGGSGALICTGKRNLLITCNHVFVEYETQKEMHDDAVLVAGRGDGQKFIRVNDFCLVSRDPGLDLVVMEFECEALLDGTSKRFFKARNWPPKKVAAGDTLHVVGFPGVHNVESHGGTARTLHATIFTDFVTSVSDRHCVLADEESVRVQKVFTAGLPKLGPLGGISGAPAFVSVGNEFEFAGIAYEAGEGTNATVFINHAAYLKADGELDYGLIPWG